MIDRLQDIFIDLLSVWIPIVGKLSDKLRYRLITLCFFSDLVLFCIVRYVLRRESYFYNTTLGIILMIVVAILSLGKNLHRIHWRRSMWIAWFGMCISFTISDIMVSKKICGLGIVLAFVFTGVFFVWQNYPRRDLLWECFKRAIKFAFLMMAVVSFLFRPLYDGGRYAGIFTNPNTFGLYLFIIFAVFISDLDWIVESGRYWYKSMWTFVGLALTIFYLSLTQARTSMVAVGVIFIMWAVLRIIRCKKMRMWRSFLKNLCLMIGVTILLYPVFKVTVTYLPGSIAHPIIFAGESLYMADGSKINDLGETVIAEHEGVEDSTVGPSGTPTNPGGDYASADIPENVMERFWYILEHTRGLNALTTGRIDIYKGYFMKLNYKGHKNVSLMINGSLKAHAHDNWLQFGYTYGIIGMVFYGIITILGIGFSLKFYIKDFRSHATYAFLIPAVCVGFVVATVTECLFLPFEVFPAFAYWFAFGDLFVKKIKKAGGRISE